MAKTKTPKDNQQYENYWKLTVEYTDIFDLRFNNVLKIIVDYIDRNKLADSGMTSKQYAELQTIIGNVYKKADAASTRKSINQFLKLGFINNKCMGYHFLTKSFLDENDRDIKASFFSRILYDNASFERSVTKVSNANEYNFLLKTLEECVVLTKEELAGIMLVDVATNTKGYLSKTEVIEQNKVAEVIGFQERKYNQLNYIFNFCQYLSGVSFGNNRISIDSSLITMEEKSVSRDPYLQRIYKEGLFQESFLAGNYKKCFVEKLAYPVLIASHIKPYRDCISSEQFDTENGLLLSKNFDSLFDLGYITFDDKGQIICSKQLDKDVVKHVSSYVLDSVFLNPKREFYMNYHRNNVFRG